MNEKNSSLETTPLTDQVESKEMPSSIIEIVSDLIQESREGSLDKKFDIEEMLDNIEDPETKEALVDLHSQIIAYDQQIKGVLHETIQEVADVNDVPPHFITIGNGICWNRKSHRLRRCFS